MESVGGEKYLHSKTGNRGQRDETADFLLAQGNYVLRETAAGRVAQEDHWPGVFVANMVYGQFEVRA